jgi:heme/copper-type cytochrome/quinol oxidase subunit 3
MKIDLDDYLQFDTKGIPISLLFVGLLSRFAAFGCIFLFFASLMAFDSPGSEKHLITWVIASIPSLAILICSYAPHISNKLYLKGKVKAAYLISGIPTAIVFTFFLKIFLTF